jgi:DHA2 family multidrug resistance protein
MLTRNTQVSHADLASHVSVFNPALQSMAASGARMDLATLNHTINQQASMIAYLNNFKLMFVVTLLVVPLLLLVRPTSHVDEEALSHAAME